MTCQKPRVGRGPAPAPPPPDGLRLCPLLGAAQAWGDGEMRAGTSTLWTSPAPCGSVWCVRMGAESVRAGGVSRIEVALEWALGLMDPGVAPGIPRGSMLDSEPPHPPRGLHAQGSYGRACGIPGPACVRRRAACGLRCSPSLLHLPRGAPRPVTGAQETLPG